MPATTIHEVWVEEFTDSLDKERIHFALHLQFKNDRNYCSEIMDGYTGEAVARALRHMAAKLERDPKLR